MKVLVTGAAGFIGSFLSRALLARGDDVVGLDNFSDYYSRRAKEFNLDLIRYSVGQKIENSSEEEISKTLKLLNSYTNGSDVTTGAEKKGKFSFYEADIREPVQLEEIFHAESIDKIVHLAAMAGVPYSLKEPLLYSTTNLDGTVNMLELSAQNNVKSFVFGSSSSIYGSPEKVPTPEDYHINQPESLYAATKRAGELICYSYNHNYKIPIVCARIFGAIYGPLQRPYGMAAQKFIRQVDYDLPITVYGDGSMKRDVTYIDDEVDGLIKCLDVDVDFEIVNVGGTGDPVSVKEMAEHTLKFMGKGKVEYIEKPSTEVKITCADTTKAKELLGYESKTSYEEGIRRQVEVYLAMPDWYRELKI